MKQITTASGIKVDQDLFLLVEENDISLYTSEIIDVMIGDYPDSKSEALVDSFLEFLGSDYTSTSFKAAFPDAYKLLVAEFTGRLRKQNDYKTIADFEKAIVLAYATFKQNKADIKASNDSFSESFENRMNRRNFLKDIASVYPKFVRQDIYHSDYDLWCVCDVEFDDNLSLNDKFIQVTEQIDATFSGAEMTRLTN